MLERNYRRRQGEIDIIAREGDTLVFVEVKTCRSASFGEPENWVDFRKQQRIGRAAACYLQQHNLEETPCRFDVVAVTLKGPEAMVRHIRDAFWL